MKLSSRISRVVVSLLLIFATSFAALISTSQLTSAACSALPTDRGNVTATVNIQTAGSYQVWSRVKTADSNNNSFLMQMDDGYCNLKVGGKNLAADTWTWVDYHDGISSQKNVMTLTTGDHTLKLAGDADNVMLDRIIFTQDTTCTPVGTGDNCSDPAPAISSVASSNVSHKSATVTWSTDQSADSQVEYGTTTSYGSSTSLSSTMVTSHSSNLTGLSPDTIYHYKVKSKNSVGNSASSSDATFKTDQTPDTTPPNISSVSSSSITQTKATITWTTNEASTSQVEYGKTTSYGSSTTKDNTKVTSHSVGLTGLSPDTTYHYSVKSADAANNNATSSDATFKTPPVPDTTPPVISSIQASSITQTSASVTWTTNEPATSQVKYGKTTSYGSSTTESTSKVTSHSVGVSGLSADTTYHYSVISKDAASNTATSPDRTFKTQAPAGDTTAPSVSITAPSNNSTVKNTVTVSASASDNVGVVGVQFKLDGNNLGSEDKTSSYSISWDSKSSSNGQHTLTAVARDAAGNTKTSSNIKVTVNNATYLAEDINKDGTVDILDFSLLSANYGKSGGAILTARTDINQDGKVDILDFSRLSAKYGQ